jgi:hypothetical protein
MDEIDGLTPAEFAARIKEKYPQYKDVEDSELVERVLLKYPVYKDKINYGDPEPEAAKTVEPKKEKAGAIESGDLDSVSVEKDSLLASKSNNTEPDEPVETDLDLETRAAAVLQKEYAASGVKEYEISQQDIEKKALEISDSEKKKKNKKVSEPIDKGNTMFEITNSELVNEREGLQNTIESRSVMADNSKELARIEEIDKINEDFLKPKGKDSTYEDWDFWGDTWKKVKANTNTQMSGLVGLPNYQNKTLVTIFAEDEQLESLNKLSPDQREAVVNSIFANSNPFSSMGMASAEAQNEFRKQASKISEGITKFDTSLSEDLVNGDYKKFGLRVASEGIGSLPTLVQAFIPYVGIASIVAGSASNKQEQLENEGYGLGWDTTANSAINGAAEGLLEVFTKKLGKKLFKSLKGVGDEFAREVFTTLRDNLVKAPLGEGISESATATIQLLSDAFIQGKDIEFIKAFYQVADAFFIGFGVGGGIGVTTQTATQMKYLNNDIKIEKIVKDSSNDYKDVKDIFKPDSKGINLDQASIVAMGGSRKFDKSLEKSLSEGEITEVQATEYKDYFNKTMKAVSKTQGVKMTPENRVKASNLIIEKEGLSDQIANLDGALAESKKLKVESINEQLNNLVNEKSEVEVAEIKQKSSDTQSASTKVSGLGFDKSNSVKAANLIKRKEVLNAEIKNLDAASAVNKKQEVESINEQLIDLINKQLENNEKSENNENSKQESKPKAKEKSDDKEIKTEGKEGDVLEKGQITPENSSNYANLTEDDKGNFVFYHVGQNGYEQIEPSSGKNKATSREEASALSKVGGLAMYYPDSRREQQVTGTSEYEVTVSKDKVYDFNSDVLNFIEEAKALHKKEHPNSAFDNNTQLAYVAKVAASKGFDMVVAEWDGRTRAQTTKSLKPTDVRTKDGNTITKDFKNLPKGNREKGFDSVIPKSKEDSMQEVYEKINEERNKAGKYDGLYRLTENSSKMSQEDITDMIDKSDLSKELKDEYKAVLGYKPESRRSQIVEKTKTVKVEGAPEGTFVNVGMEEGVSKAPITSTELKSKLPKDVEVLDSGVAMVKSDGGVENSLSLKLSRPLTDLEMKNFLAGTKQKAIPQMIEGKGTMFGTKEWGDFNPEFFYMPDGSNLSDIEVTDSKSKTSTDSEYKTLADAIRSLKINKNMADANSKIQSNPLAIPAAVWDGALETVASAVELTGSINEAINLGIENIKKSDWYKTLSKKDRRESLAKFKKQTLDVYNSKAITPAQAYERSRQAAERSRKESNNEAKPFVERFKARLSGLVDKYIDRQGSIKKALKNIGLSDVITYMVNKGGYSAAAKNQAESVYKKTFKGLSTENIKRLEEIIQHLRTISISENREARGLDQIDRQEGLTRAGAENTLEGYRELLGDEVYSDLNKRAEEYFAAYKEVLGDMKDSGLISKEFYDDFVEVDYKPTQYLEFLKNKDQEFDDAQADKGNNSTLGQNPIKTSGKGSIGSELMDAWGILERSILTRTRSLFENKLNTTFVEQFTKQKKEVEALIKRGNLSKAELKRVKDFSVVDNLTILDEVIGFTEGNNPKYARDGKDNKGYKSLYYYTGGVKNRILLDENFYNKFTDTNNKIINGNVRENVALITGTAAVKSFATGNNPLFFATNLPRDFAFTVTFSKEYSAEVFSNSVKLAIGLVKGVRSVFKNGKDYKLYLEHGGGMDYLALQGKYRSKGWSKTVVDKVLSKRNQDFLFRGKILRGINKFNLASEVGIRLAVFNKSLKNSLEGRDIDKLDKKEKDLIYGRAVESARLLTDFSQGGTVTKALDAGIPYLNAATQGTRAAVNNFYERPLETSARIAQVTGYTVSATVAATLGMISQFRDDEDEEVKGMNNAQIYFETLETVSEYDLQNYYIMPLGTKDADGNWKYSRIAKAQALSPFLNAAEHFTRLKLAEATGNKYEADLGKIIVNTTMENMLPISPTLKATIGRTPIVNAYIATLGIDAYTGNPLSFDNSRPDQLEGIDDDRVQLMFKKIGEEFNTSPVRLQKAIESIITSPSTNLYVGLSYAVGNATTSLLSDDDSKELGVDNLSPAFKRFVKSGSEYNRTSKLLKKVSPDALKAYRKHIMLKKDIKTTVANIRSGKKVLGDEIKRLLKDNSKDDATRIESWLRSEYKREDKSNLTYTLRRINNPEVRAIILSEKFGDGLFKIRGMNDSDMKLVKELRDTGILNGETLKYYNSLNDLEQRKKRIR